MSGPRHWHCRTHVHAYPSSQHVRAPLVPHATHARLRDPSDTALHPRCGRGWVDTTERRAAAKLDRLESELNGYKTNLIKESIRMGHNDLGDFHYARGDLQVPGAGVALRATLTLATTQGAPCVFCCLADDGPLDRGADAPPCRPLRRAHVHSPGGASGTGSRRRLSAVTHWQPALASSLTLGLRTTMFLILNRDCMRVQNAFKCYVRTRDYCTTPKHIVAMCLAVIKCGIEMNNFAHVNNYVQKAEQTPDVAVRIAANRKIGSQCFWYPP